MWHVFTENEKLKIEKKKIIIIIIIIVFWNVLVQTFTTFRFYKSNCFTKGMLSCLGSAVSPVLSILVFSVNY